jgi:hypothetical protein
MFLMPSDVPRARFVVDRPGKKLALILPRLNKLFTTARCARLRFGDAANG